MEYRQLGNSGVRVSVIGLGTNRFGSPPLPQEEVTRIIDFALEAGINHIDSANSYVQGQSEITLGRALKGRREKFVLATKFYNPIGDGSNDRGASRYHIMNACEVSLQRLQTDHIDLYYLHRWDPNTPIEETLRALDDLIRLGKVRYIGCSDLAAWQLAHANLLAELRGWSKFVVIQSEYNLVERGVEKEVLPYCRAHDVGFVPYHPLAGGFLTGKYRRGLPPPPGSRGQTAPYMKKYMAGASYYDRIEKLEAWAQARDRSLNELAEAWLLAQSQICSVISGASRCEQVVDNIKVIDWHLAPSDLKEIEALLA